MLSSLHELSHSLQTREISSVELTQYCIDQIQKKHHLNALISVDEEYAHQQAKHADLILGKQQARALTGIPMVVKDLFCTHQMTTTCGSNMLSAFKAPFQATVVTQLMEQGAILLGKSNMDEFAMGSASDTSPFGAVRNPWDLSKSAGGSSGGSAAAVSARLVPFALGSDTGGSIRQPASFCGISGIKPTYGLASRHGMIAYASSMDQAGPMACHASDLALLLQIMAGFDCNDATSVKQPVPKYLATLQKPLTGLRLGLPTCFWQVGIDATIQKIFSEAVATLEALGAHCVEVDLPHHALWVPCYYVLACAEASSNLARYDGIRFGNHPTHADNINDFMTASRTDGFGLEVKRRILTGTHVLSAGHFDAYFLQAQKIRRLIQEELLSALKTVDLLLSPTTPSSAFSLGEPNDPISRYLADVFTVAANLAGIPALSIPAGLHQGLPIGLQLMGKHFSENLLLRVAHQFQQQTHWHLLNPTSRNT